MNGEHPVPDFAKGDGLVPVVIQDFLTRRVLMLGYMNDVALQATVTTGELYLWSRSRRQLWHKGEPSGNVLFVRNLALDCDADALLAEVEPATGTTPVCHTGADTCFFTSIPLAVERGA